MLLHDWGLVVVSLLSPMQLLCFQLLGLVSFWHYFSLLWGHGILNSYVGIALTSAMIWCPQDLGRSSFQRIIWEVGQNGCVKEKVREQCLLLKNERVVGSGRIG